MRPTPEEEERMQQEHSARGASLGPILAAQREARVEENNEENPRPSRPQQKRRYDELVENCARRPEPRSMFYNPLGRALSALICACNCAINLVAADYPPVVFMLFMSLFGCTCAKKGDIVAIPKDYIEYALAVYTLIHAKYEGQIDPWAFVGYRALERKLSLTPELPGYDLNGRVFDSNYDGEERFDRYRVSLIAPTTKKTLLPMSKYRPRLDLVGQITSETVGWVGTTVVEIPCIVQGVETVVAVKCRRRQFVMVYLSFAFGLVGSCWAAAHALDFAALREGVAAATIGNIIESSCKGQAGVRLVGKFMVIYIPIFKMLQAFLIEAFGGRLPNEDELEVVLNKSRGEFRLGEVQLQDGAVAGDLETEAVSRMRGGLARLNGEIGTVLSPARVKEIKKATQPGWRGKTWSSYYAVRDYAKGGFRRRRIVDDDDDDGDERPSKSMRVGEGMPSAADWDDSCKAVEPQGSTNPRSGVRRNLLADIRRHQSKNAVHQAPIG